MKKFVPLVIVALMLGAVAAIGWLTAPPGDSWGLLIAVLALVMLLSLPAVVARMLRASGRLTWLISFLVPLGAFEIPRGISAAQRASQHLGGDLGSIDTDAMVLLGIMILVTASLVAMVAVRRYPLPSRD